MYFIGKLILINNIRGIVADMTADIEDLLQGSLIFKKGEDVWFTILLAEIKDDLTQTQQGKSFIHSNSLTKKEVEMLEDLVNRRRKREFLDKNS